MKPFSAFSCSLCVTLFAGFCQWICCDWKRCWYRKPSRRSCWSCVSHWSWKKQVFFNFPSSSKAMSRPSWSGRNLGSSVQPKSRQIEPKQSSVWYSCSSVLNFLPKLTEAFGFDYIWLKIRIILVNSASSVRNLVNIFFLKNWTNRLPNQKPKFFYKPAELNRNFGLVRLKTAA